MLSTRFPSQQHSMPGAPSLWRFCRKGGKPPVLNPPRQKSATAQSRCLFLRNPQDLMRLQTQPPLRMLHAVPHRQLRIRQAVRPIHWLQKEMSKSEPLKLPGCACACGNTSFNSSPAFCTSRAPTFGLTHTQSIPAGASTVPFVSTAISKSRSCSASISTRSSCSKGSPPVQTTNRVPSAPRTAHVALIASARSSAVSNLPPPGPSTPTNSVSQNWQIADARSLSRPDHKLHPANRQNTAARPACAPSPCSV